MPSTGYSWYDKMRPTLGRVMDGLLDKIRPTWWERSNTRGMQGKEGGDPGPGSPTPQGGWDVLYGTVAMKDYNDIWWDTNGSLTKRDLERVYKMMAVVYACVRKLSTAAAEAPIKMYEGDEQTEDSEVKKHPILSALQDPNPKMSYPEFLQHVILHLMLTGESHVLEFRNKGGIPNELWPIPTSWLNSKYNKRGDLIYYEMWQGQNNPPAPVLPEDITTISFPDPENPHRGMGPLQAAIRDTQTDSERQNYIIEMLTNLKVPGMVLKQEQAFTPMQKKEIRQELSDRVGRGKRGSPLFLEGKEAGIELIAPLKDLDWPGLSNLNETRICAVFGVPPILVGLRSGLETATYSNYEQAMEAFYKGTMVPLWKSLDAALTRGLITNEGETRDLHLCHDLKDIKHLSEDQNETATRAGTLLQGSVCTRNESRAMVGLPPLMPELGEVFLVPMGMQEVRADLTPLQAAKEQQKLDDVLGINQPQQPDGSVNTPPNKNGKPNKNELDKGQKFESDQDKEDNAA